MTKKQRQKLVQISKQWASTNEPALRRQEVEQLSKEVEQFFRKAKAAAASPAIAQPITL